MYIRLKKIDFDFLRKSNLSHEKFIIVSKCLFSETNRNFDFILLMMSVPGMK